MKIDYSEDAEEVLQKLRKSNSAAAKQIVRQLEKLAITPKPPDDHKMKGSDYLRVRAGAYRIIYSVRNDVLSIRLIGKRNDDEIYRQHSRLLQ